MCNINILIKTNKEKDFTGFLMGSTSNSYISNSHGDGIYFNKSELLIKQLKKINLCNYKEEIKNSNIILSHQRLATSGFCNDYTHPFISKNFVMVHNGIINDFLKSKGSDTSGFFEDFNKMFTEMNKDKIERENIIVSCIKSLLDTIGGSYSIGILDKETDILYYFKNSLTNIHFYRFNNNLFITTNKDNKKFIEMEFKNISEIDIKDYTIYKIQTKKDKIKIYEIGKIEEEPPIIYEYSKNNTQTSFKSYGVNSWNESFKDKPLSKKQMKRLRRKEEKRRMKENNSLYNYYNQNLKQEENEYLKEIQIAKDKISYV